MGCQQSTLTQLDLNQNHTETLNKHLNPKGGNADSRQRQEKRTRPQRPRHGRQKRAKSPQTQRHHVLHNGQRGQEGRLGEHCRLYTQFDEALGQSPRETLERHCHQVGGIERQENE